MIRFSCPRCNSVLQAPDHRAGSKTACPKCQQRLQIPVPPPNKPVPPPNKTVLAPLVEYPRGLGRSPAAQVPQMQLSTPPEEPTIERGRLWRPWLGCVVGTVAVLLGLAIVGLGVRLALTGGYIRPAGQVPEKRTDARTDEEELVKRYILNIADKDADKVRFLTWGPHMSRREFLDL